MIFTFPYLSVRSLFELLGEMRPLSLPPELPVLIASILCLFVFPRASPGYIKSPGLRTQLEVPQNVPQKVPQLEGSAQGLRC